MFGNENSLEPAVRPIVRRKPTADDADTPIREATRAEIRRQRTPPPAETDAIAKRHNLYTADTWSGRVYYTDYQQKSEVMRASASRISTKLDDRQTVSAMLDLADARGWRTVKLNGTADFRREAWVQANVRGMSTEGYNPKPTDLQEYERRKEAAKPVEAAPAARTVPPAKAAAPRKQTSAPAQTKQTPAEAAQPTPEVVKQTPEEAVRQAEKAVWGPVEAAGQQARGNDPTKPAAVQESENPGAGMQPNQAEAA